MMYKPFSIIVVNWNAGSQLHNCIDSIIRYAESLVDQIIVVDNGSTDCSENSIEGLPNITLIRNGENLGFGKGCNIGAAHANSEFLLFLNPDARLFPDSLAKILDFIQTSRNAKVGICGVQLLDENGCTYRSCSRFPSVSGFIAHATGLERIVPTIGHAMNEWDHATTRQVDQVIGAFFMVRHCVFKALHGFDERFFVYFEEVDFSYRAKQLGWSSVYLADIQAFHAGGGTSRQVKAKRLFYSLRSRILYAFKHFNPLGASVTLVVTLLVEPFSRSVQDVIRCSWVSLNETWTAYGMLFRWLPNWIFKGIGR
jgi:GT2 family glycosyltransferase